MAPVIPSSRRADGHREPEYAPGTYHGSRSGGKRPGHGSGENHAGIKPTAVGGPHAIAPRVWPTAPAHGLQIRRQPIGIVARRRWQKRKIHTSVGNLQPKRLGPCRRIDQHGSKNCRHPVAAGRPCHPHRAAGHIGHGHHAGGAAVRRLDSIGQRRRTLCRHRADAGVKHSGAESKSGHGGKPARTTQFRIHAGGHGFSGLTRL